MRPRIKITPAVVLASVAIVIASSGSAYAASKITSSQIKDGTIRGEDIRPGTIGGSKIKNGSLNPQDFAKGTLRTGPKGATGPQGPQGPAGAGRWLLVDASGAIVAQSGGFSVASAYDAPGAPAGAVGNVYINANEDLSNNAVTVSIALQNKVEQDNNANVNGRAAGPDANAEFSGEITTTVCGIAGVVGCAPTGTDNRNHLVVSPRMSDGSFTTGTNRKRFYVSVTGDSADFVSPSPAIPAKALAVAAG